VHSQLTHQGPNGGSGSKDGLDSHQNSGTGKSKNVAWENDWDLTNGFNCWILCLGPFYIELSSKKTLYKICYKGPISVARPRNHAPPFQQ
jgi:hypothetical protein